MKRPNEEADTADRGPNGIPSWPGLIPRVGLRSPPKAFGPKGVFPCPVEATHLPTRFDFRLWNTQDDLEEIQLKETQEKVILNRPNEISRSRLWDHRTRAEMKLPSNWMHRKRKRLVLQKARKQVGLLRKLQKGKLHQKSRTQQEIQIQFPLTSRKIHRNLQSLQKT